MDNHRAVEKAIGLRADGLSYSEIGRALGVHRTTVAVWVNPEKGREKLAYARDRRKRESANVHERDKTWRERNREKLREYSREYLANNRSRVQEWHKSYAASIEGRCRRALNASRHCAKRYGYEPCHATLDEIVGAFTGRCFICGIDECECTRRLCMDHCHETGRFRGWLCQGCNTSIEHVINRPRFLQGASAYLEGVSG